MTDLLAQVRIDLRGAARDVRRYGFHQCDLYDFDQVWAESIDPARARKCGFGAIATAITGRPVPDDLMSNPRIAAAYRHLGDYMTAFYGAPTFAAWNDAEGRAGWEVALLLRKAAAWTPTPAKSESLAA